VSGISRIVSNISASGGLRAMDGLKDGRPPPSHLAKRREREHCNSMLRGRVLVIWSRWIL
jgi:hypothetical protein